MRPQLLMQRNGLCLVGLGGGQTRHMPTASYRALIAKHDAEATAPARRAKLALAAEYITDRERQLDQERRKLADLAFKRESERKARELEKERTDIQMRAAAAAKKANAEQLKRVTARCFRERRLAAIAQSVVNELAGRRPAPVRQPAPAPVPVQPAIAATSPAPRFEPVVYDVIEAVAEWHRTPKLMLVGVPTQPVKTAGQKSALKIAF